MLHLTWMNAAVAERRYICLGHSVTHVLDMKINRYDDQQCVLDMKRQDRTNKRVRIGYRQLASRSPLNQLFLQGDY